MPGDRTPCARRGGERNGAPGPAPIAHSDSNNDMVFCSFCMRNICVLERCFPLEYLRFLKVFVLVCL